MRIRPRASVAPIAFPRLPPRRSCYIHMQCRLPLKPAQRKMRILPLIAATYFMVSGGPYGIEDILGGAGYGWAILILLVLPILWSLPTALMIGELASAIPAEGGFYVWVRRALGPFWGYQEGWLSLSASIFDMALYPSIFVLYLGKFAPALTAGWRGYRGQLAVVVALLRVESARRARCRRRLRRPVCSASRSLRCLHGARLLARSHAASRRHWGQHCCIGSNAALLHGDPRRHVELHGLGQRIHRRQEVENPQRNYPRAMIGAAILTAFTYILPLLPWRSPAFPAGFSTGDWMTAANASAAASCLGRRRRRRHLRHSACSTRS